MYERSAIVLERYFNNVLGYFSENNLKVNYENYCSLVEKIEKFQSCYEQEQIAIQEFEDVTDRLKTIQKTEDKLYKKSAKLEYNRNILFNNIENKTENIENCLIKIENDIDKNVENFKTLRVDYINTLNEFNEKSKVLSKSKKAKKDAEIKYHEALEIAQENSDNINEFVLELARNFNGPEIGEKLLNLMIDNGKEEKIPFDEEVINLAVDLGIDIAQKEVQCYVDAYDNLLTLFDEIDKNDVKIEKYQRRIRNIKVKLNFIFAEKEYLVQFLDYERMTSVNGKRTHKKLMEQACENFKLDVNQISNLYELILNEIANKCNQKIYKALYNKSYLVDMKQAEETLRKEKNKVNLAVATILGSNYWRIEGIKNIYTVFYKDVSKVFGRDLDEFEVPAEEDLENEVIEESIPENTAEKIQLAKAEKISKEQAKSNVKIIEEIDDNELPQLISEEEEETLSTEAPIPEAIDIVKVVEKVTTTNKKADKKKDELDIIQKIEQIVEEIDAIEAIKPIKKAKKSAIIETTEKNEDNVSVLEKTDAKSKVQHIAENELQNAKAVEPKENKSQIIETTKDKKRRKDIIKEEEENKKKAKIKEKGRRVKTDEIQIIEKTEEKEIEPEKVEIAEVPVENVEIIEEVKPKRRRKDIIKEEEEKKKEVAKVKEKGRRVKKDEIQIIEEKEEPKAVEKIEIKEEEQDLEEAAFEEEISNIQDIETETSNVEDEAIYEVDEEEESLFGNIKSAKTTRRNNLDLEMLEQLEKKNKSSKKGIFNSLIKMNSNKGKRVAD